MKRGFTLKVFKLKERELWPRSPITKIKESKKIYCREREKERLRRERRKKYNGL